jgi:hypothetical protein
MNRRILILALSVVALIFLQACGGTPTSQPGPVATAQPGATKAAPTVQPTPTPKPTAVPAATSTPKPTNTPLPPTATLLPPTPSKPPLEILSHQSYTDAGWFHIVGEARNNTNGPMQFVKIVATLYDKDNKVVGTTFTYTDLDVIPAGGKSPFELGTDKWTGTTQYKVQVEGRAGGSSRQDLVISSHKSYKDGDWLHVQGEVKNTGTTPATFVKVIITLYDANGNVAGKLFTYTTLDTIPAGGTSPFDSGTDHWPNFDHYEIQVQGK